MCVGVCVRQAGSVHSRLEAQNCCLPPAEPRQDMGDQQRVGPSLPASLSPHHPPLPPMVESQTIEDAAKGVTDTLGGRGGGDRHSGGLVGGQLGLK